MKDCFAEEAPVRRFLFSLALTALSQVNFRGTSFWTRFGRLVAPLVFVSYAVAVIAMLFA